MPDRPPKFNPFKTAAQPQQGRSPHVFRHKTSCQKGYNYRWQKDSKVYLREHPCCVDCEREGIVAPATVVDHIKPHRGDMALFWDVSNWQALCATHHNRKTARGE